MSTSPRPLLGPSAAFPIRKRAAWFDLRAPTKEPGDSPECPMRCVPVKSCPSLSQRMVGMGCLQLDSFELDGVPQAPHAVSSPCAGVSSRVLKRRRWENSVSTRKTSCSHTDLFSVASRKAGSLRTHTDLAGGKCAHSRGPCGSWGPRRHCWRSWSLCPGQKEALEAPDRESLPRHPYPR